MLAGFKALSTGTKLVIGGAVVGLMALAIYLFVSGFFAGQDKRVEEAGAAGETRAVAEGQARTLEMTGDVNNARNEIRRAGERDLARFCDCLLDSRDSATCERYRPVDDIAVCE